MDNYKIYGLYEPDGITLRYIGQTKHTVKRRFNEHINNGEELIIIPRLEEWFFTEDLQQIKGRIYDDEKMRFNDGYVVTTSRIVEIDPKRKWVQTLNTKYRLGKPYEAEKCKSEDRR